MSIKVLQPFLLIVIKCFFYVGIKTGSRVQRTIGRVKIEKCIAIYMRFCCGVISVQNFYFLQDITIGNNKLFIANCRIFILAERYIEFPF